MSLVSIITLAESSNHGCQRASTHAARAESDAIVLNFLLVDGARSSFVSSISALVAEGRSAGFAGWVLVFGQLKLGMTVFTFGTIRTETKKIVLACNLLLVLMTASGSLRIN